METEMDQMDHGGSSLDQPVDDSLSGDEMFMTTMDEPDSTEASDMDHDMSHDDHELMTTMDDADMETFSTLGQAESLSELSDVQTAGLMAFAGVWMVFSLVILAVSIAAFWKIFTKAGQAGWKSLIPIYSAYVLLQIIGRPGWWLLLLFVPFVNIVIAIITSIDTAKSFGRSEVFGIVGLFLFSLIGYCILAFGGDKYVGPAGQQPTDSPPDPSVDVAAPVA